MEALGGTIPYQYNIDSGTFGNTPFFNELTDGVHIISVADNNNCSTDTTITLFTEYELIADFGLNYIPILTLTGPFHSMTPHRREILPPGFGSSVMERPSRVKTRSLPTGLREFIRLP